MSDAKPEETVTAVETKPTEPIATPAVVETVPAAAIVVEAPAKPEEVAEEKKEEEAAPEKSEPKEITQGALSKSNRGLLSFFKHKRFFYFQDEAISDADLKTYLHKDNSSKATAAYALQTGKGLWFYSKDEGHKATHGIIKLADVTDVIDVGSNKFVLKQSTGDLHFEAPAVERDSWVYTLKSKVNEAKTIAETVVESEGYKAALEKLHAKPVYVKPAAKEEPKETTEEAKPAATEEAKPEAVPETAVTSDEEAGPSDTKTDMRRSQSKKSKRISGFNVHSFLPKREKAEEKKDEKKGEEVVEAAKPDAADVPAAPAPGVEPAVTEPAAAEAKPAEEEAKAEEARPEPKKNRQSFFARFGKRDEPASEEKKDKEPEVVAPAATETAATTTDKVAETAPVIDIPAEEKKEEKKDVKTPSSPKSDLLSFFTKRDKSPAPKAAVAADEKAEEKAESATSAAAAVEPAAEAPKEVAPAATEETPAAEAAKDKDAAVTGPKERRKSSFFGFGGKDKKTDEVKSDSEDTESTSPKPSTSPVPKNFLGSLKRKVSKAGKSDKETKEVATPAVVAEEEAPKAPETAEAIQTEPETKPDETVAETAPALGDVVAAKPVQATA